MLEIKNKIKVICFFIVLFLVISCNRPYEIVYYDTGEKKTEYFYTDDDYTFVKSYYKNGSLALIATMDSLGNFVNEITEYYADGIVKYHGPLQSHKSNYVYEYNPYNDYTKYLKCIDINGVVIQPNDTTVYTLCLNDVYSIRFLTDSIHYEMFVPFFSIEDKQDLYYLNPNDINPEMYPYMISVDSSLCKNITIYCLFKNENREPSFSQRYVKWKFNISKCE